MAQWKGTHLVSMRMRVPFLAPLIELKIRCCRKLWCVGRRLGLDLVLLWLWHWPAAVAPIQPLAWELPYAAGVALKTKKKKKRKNHIGE